MTPSPPLWTRRQLLHAGTFGVGPVALAWLLNQDRLESQFWDHHGSIRTALPAACRMTDRPAAALVADLKARGRLDSTVGAWGGEMGRLPVIQNDAGPAKVGRDHNTCGFS